MPCYEPRPAELLQEANEKIHKLTDMLCRVCKQRDEMRDEVERNGLLIEVSPLDGDTLEWWIKHQFADNIRRTTSNS